MEHTDKTQKLGGVDPERAATSLHVPDGFFDGLTPRVMQAVHQNRPSGKPETPFNWVNAIGMAGTIGTVALLVVLVIDKMNPVIESELDLAAATRGLTIEDVVLLTDAGADDLVITGLLLPDTLETTAMGDRDAAIQLLIESGIDEEELINDIEI